MTYVRSRYGWALLCLSALHAGACASEPSSNAALPLSGAGGAMGGVSAAGLGGVSGTPNGGTGGESTAGTGGTAAGTGGTGASSGGGGGIGGIGGMDTGGAGGTAGSGGIGGEAAIDAGNSGGTGGSDVTCPLPERFAWTSSGVLAEPKSPAGKDWASLKDFSVARDGEEYLLYGTAFDKSANAWTGVFITVGDFADLAAAEQTWLGAPLAVRNTVAPQIMYFSPKDVWVLTYQWGFQFATSTTPSDPTSWSATQALLSGNPAAGHGGTGPIDQTVICDDDTCYIFFAGDNGRIYRGSMPIGDFPAAFSNATTIMQDSTANLFEGVEVYSVKGSDQYLMIVEAMGAGGRYFRAFTSDDLGGTFEAMPDASTESEPFAGKMNVTFEGSAWTSDISHGDIVRDDPSEKKPIDPCNLRFLYQGRNPTINVRYEELPYRPGLLTLEQ